MTIQDKPWAVDPQALLDEAMKSTNLLITAAGQARQKFVDEGFDEATATRLAEQLFTFMLQGGRK